MARGAWPDPRHGKHFSTPEKNISQNFFDRMDSIYRAWHNFGNFFSGRARLAEYTRICRILVHSRILPNTLESSRNPLECIQQQRNTLEPNRIHSNATRIHSNAAEYTRTPNTLEQKRATKNKKTHFWTQQTQNHMTIPSLNTLERAKYTRTQIR